MTERELIAERTIYAVDNNGRGFEMRLMIGRPYESDPTYGVWACPVALKGLHGSLSDIYGDDSWQALMLARDLLKRLLTYFVEDGGQLFSEEGGSEINIEALFDAGVDEHPVPDGGMTSEQLERIAELTDAEVQRIDNSIISHCKDHWRKVAMVVGSALLDNLDTIPDVPDLFYADRVKKLVQTGKLESQGNLYMMRFSEIRCSS